MPLFYQAMNPGAEKIHRLLREHPFLVIGHRGAAGLAPENTLQSFQRALQLGCPMLELDVYRIAANSGGYELCVIHDETLDRTTNQRGPVAALQAADLAHIDAGNGQPIPTLADVVNLVQATPLQATRPQASHLQTSYPQTSYPQTPHPQDFYAQTSYPKNSYQKDRTRHAALNIELKGPDTASAVAQFLANSNISTVLVSSFDHQALAHFRKLDPLTPVAPLFHRWRRRWQSTAAALDAVAVNLSARIVTPARVRAIRQAGYAVFVYTVNQAADAEKLASLGVNGIFTDRPDRMHNWLS